MARSSVACSSGLGIGVAQRGQRSCAVVSAGVQVLTDGLYGVGEQLDARNGRRQQERAIIPFACRVARDQPFFFHARAGRQNRGVGDQAVRLDRRMDLLDGQWPVFILCDSIVGAAQAVGAL